MAFLRSPATATTTTAIAFFAFSSSSSFKSPPTKPQTLSLFSSQPLSLFSQNRLPIVKNFVIPPSALHMDAPSSDHKPTSQVLPELLIDVCSIEVNMSYFIGIVDVSNMFGVTEFMVDMKCEGCVNAVKNKLQAVDGVKNVEVDLTNQVVRILGSSPVKTMTEALEQTGRKARLIGQGVPEEFLVPAAVGEFKVQIFLVWFAAQVNMECARIEASFSGLSPGKHGWSVNEYGDLTKVQLAQEKCIIQLLKELLKRAPLTGRVACTLGSLPLGDLGTLDVNDEGNATFSGVKEKLRVSDLIGRSIAVYGTEDKSDSGVTAAVIARSAGVGENHKKICLCDGTTIWESTNSDFVASKV
ncbi:hypothetical protein Pint_15974 [Pistacia integerrima]|uniref:Uncharacterized protein n=1 Tax=Pistacia integerrima TaxID=434235 RepID=A0ACC0ZC52_9ROSI|nr:hypothetical protein Pint_15974 [Pistacia integerrima]